MTHGAKTQVIPMVYPDSRVVAAAGSTRSANEQRFEAPVDLDATAERLRVRVAMVNLPGRLEGLTISCDELLVASDLNAERRRFVTAHEFAHVLVRRGSCSVTTSRDGEWFADAFARELLVPAAWVAECTSLSAVELAREAQVEERVALAQLAAVGRVPPIVRWSGEVICGRCGHRGGLSSCPCLRFRQRRELPLPAPLAS